MAFNRLRRKFPIYDSIYFDIIVSDSSEEISKELEDEESWFACVSKTTFKDEQGKIRKSITVVLCTEGDNEITPAIMVHEAVHVKNVMFTQIGQKNSTKMGHDETEAYFVEWIFQEISNFFKESMKYEEELKSKEDER